MRTTPFLSATLALALAGSMAVQSGCDKSNRVPSNAEAPRGIGGDLPDMPAADAMTDPRLPGVHGGSGSGDPHAGLDMGGAGVDPHAGLDMNGQNPHGSGGMQGTMPAAGPLDPNSVIEGVIDVAPALKDKIKPGDVIFLSAKLYDEATGELKRGPLAVDRLEVAKLPQPFALSNQNQMMQGAKLEGGVKVAITARVDRDVDVLTRNPGDLEAVVKTAAPQKDLKVVIDTEVK
jgi:hypothetical protein